jgi:hypothetical protein
MRFNLKKFSVPLGLFLPIGKAEEKTESRVHLWDAPVCLHGALQYFESTQIYSLNWYVGSYNADTPLSDFLISCNY